MNMSDYLSGIVIMDCLSIIILFGIIVSYKHIEDKGKIKGRIFITLLITVAIYAFIEMAYSVIQTHHSLDILWNVGVAGIQSLIEHLYCFLMAVFVLSLAGYDRAPRRHHVLIYAPFAVDIVFSIVILILSMNRLVTGDIIRTAIHIMGIARALIGYAYIVLSIIVLWRIGRVLSVFPTILVVVMIFFDNTYNPIYSRSLLMTLCILYLYLSVLKPGLLVHIGSIMLTLFIMATLIIGNAVTSAAFSSYLKTLHDRNDEHLKHVQKVMENYEALPWLIDYWIDNAASIRVNLEEDPDAETSFNNNLKGITVDEASGMTDSMQLSFATACYKNIDDVLTDEYITHNLDDLFLIVPFSDDKAIELFDAEKNPDGSCRLGDDFDIDKESSEWKNYDTEIKNDYHWTWGRYSEEDDFGFYRTLPSSLKGYEVRLCNSFRRSEIYAHMNYISMFRIKTIGYLMVVAVVILLSLYLMIIRPLSFMGNTMKQYSSDKDALVVANDLKRIQQKDEIGDFAREFTSLTGEMKRYTEEVANLAGEKERVATELRMAADIQTKALPSVFPPFPECHEFDIFASMKPAKEVGGDFYDFFLMDKRHLAFLIADVSDKGVPAALFMMSVNNLIKYRAREGGTPGEILTSVNSQVCMNNKAMMFATVWMGILDPDSGVITCANAGHERPAVSAEGGGFKLIDKDEHGTPIGMLGKMRYKDYEIRLKEGESIFLYTDGVTEAKNGSGEFYSAGRMIRDLADAEASASPRMIIDNMSAQIEEYVQAAEQFDDITMLCLTYYGNRMTKGIPDDKM